MSEDITVDYESLYYIRTRSAEDKRPMDKWGGYNQPFDDAEHVYTHEEITMMPDDHWAVVGVEDAESMAKTTLVFDLDVHKAPDDFDVDQLDVAADTLLVKSQSGGFHLYFTVHGEHQDYDESDFEMTHDLGWDIDIRGSAVGQHVVAPTDIPGVETPYEIVQDEPIKNVLDPADAAERVRFDGEPLLKFSPSRGSVGDYDIDRDAEPPEEMPTCYHRGLQLREASPDDHPNTHKVNVLTALCGLYAGYSVEAVTDHFLEYAPDQADRGKTEYQVQHLAEKIDLDMYSPPSISSLRNYAILDEDEGCECDIPYHGGDDDENLPQQTWEWWSDARLNGKFGPESIIPDAALWHIADEHTSYPIEALPDGYDELPAVAARKSLGWLDTVWADRVGIDTDDEEVTERSPPHVDGDEVVTWEGVRYIYSESNQRGRYAAVQLLRQRFYFLTPEDTEELHVYDEELGIYDWTATYKIGRTLDRELGSYYSQHEKTEIIGRLKERKVRREQLEAGEFDANYLCVENGVLNLDTRELEPHDPEFKFTAHLPQRYDPDTDCPAIKSFLDDITRREADAKTLLEMLGNTLLDNYDYESFLVLFGEGSNGKSTWFEAVRKFLGTDNVESMTLQQITDNRFAASNLVGKWANIGEDLPAKKIHDLGTLKDLTGGGETWVEPKGKEGFSFRNRAKMMFAANDPPVLGERTKAVARRILPVRLPYQFTTEPNDGHKDAQKEGLLDSLTTDEELSGLLNAALDGLERLRENGDFSLPESNQERLEYYEQMSDHIKNFAVNCLENEREQRVGKSDIYNAYTNFCDAEGFDAVAKSTFWTQLRKTTLNISEIRPELPNGERPRMMDNMTFTAEGVQYAPDFTVDDASDAPTISTLAPGDSGVTIEARAESVETDTPPQIAEKVTVRDVTGQITITVFDDAGIPSLDEGECYRIKNVDVETYDGHREVLVNSESALEPINVGVGNSPSADPGDNSRLDAAADGGETQQQQPEDDNDDREDFVENLRPNIVMYVREKESQFPEGVPKEMIVGHFVPEGYDADHVTDAISAAVRQDGSLIKDDEGRLTAT